MVKALADIQAKVDFQNQYIGDGPLKKYRAEWEQIKQQPPNGRHWQVLFSMANGELNLGNEQEAIQLYSQALSIGTHLRNRLPAGTSRKTAFALAVGCLRRGETENCCALNGPESCLFPIRPAAIHTKQEGSRTAIKLLQHILSLTSPDSGDYKRARWLLNLAYMTVDEYPNKVPPKLLIDPKVFDSDEPFPQFHNTASDRGLNSFGLSGGAITEDFDNDGDLDLMVSDWNPSGQMQFLKNNGSGKFTSHTKDAGLQGITGGLNMVQADFNNDGHVDVYVMRGAWLGRNGQHPNSLLRNNGDGTFTDITFSAGLAQKNFPTPTASWGDYDLDGDVDLFVGNESLAVFGQEDITRAPSDCQLFRNNGDETFTDVAQASGVTNNRFTKGVIWGDYDNDRWPDLYVSNLASDNRLYHNNGDGTFTDVAPELKVTQPNAGFPAWFWDYDNDGHLDIYASAYSARVKDVLDFFVGNKVIAEPGRLYRGTGDGFTEVGEASNLIRPCNTMGSNFGDLNNDGYLDFYLGTGTPPYSQLMPNVMYLNKAGKKFADVTTAGGFGNLQKGHAVAFADFDNDGDQDVFEQMGGAYLGDRYYDLFFENPGFGNNWIAIDLVGVDSNRSAIGARIKIEIEDAGTKRTVFRHVNSGGTFGGNPLMQTLGIGKAKRIDRLEIFWPKSNATQVFQSIDVNKRIRITEGLDEIK